MNEENNIDKYAKQADPSKFIYERTNFLKTSNEEMKLKLDQVVKQLKTEDLVLYSLPFIASVFYDQDDRTGKINGTFINFGERCIHDIELVYTEWKQGGGCHHVGNQISVICKYSAPGQTISESEFFVDLSSVFSDENMSFGKNCFFLEKEQYLSFKKIIISFRSKLFGESVSA